MRAQTGAFDNINRHGMTLTGSFDALPPMISFFSSLLSSGSSFGELYAWEATINEAERIFKESTKKWHPNASTLIHSLLLHTISKTTYLECVIHCEKSKLGSQKLLSNNGSRNGWLSNMSHRTMVWTGSVCFDLISSIIQPDNLEMVSSRVEIFMLILLIYFE